MYISLSSFQNKFLYFFSSQFLHLCLDLQLCCFGNYTALGWAAQLLELPFDDIDSIAKQEWQAHWPKSTASNPVSYTLCFRLGFFSQASYCIFALTYSYVVSVTTLRLAGLHSCWNCHSIIKVQLLQSRKAIILWVAIIKRGM